MKKIRIGSGAGYAGDRIEPAIDLIERGNLDYIIFECLAERTISLAQKAKMEDQKKGYNALFEYRFDRILDALLPPPKNQWGEVENHDTNSSTRQAFRKKLREGQLDDKEIEIDVSAGVSMGVEIMAPPGMEEMTNQLQSMFQSLGSDKTKKRKMKIKDALKTLIDDDAA